jgi:thiamine biosynthesis lipoprotein ApbE
MDSGVMTSRRDQHAEAARASGMAVADWPALGTTAELVVTDPSALVAARQAVEEELAAIDVAASRFRDDSEIARLNAAAGEWQPVSTLLARLLRVAIDAADWTDGLVDPTVGAALIDLGYDRTFCELPTDGPSLTVVSHEVPGYLQIELDEAGGRARVPAGTIVDLGATAKGVAADMCAVAAASVGDCGALVSLGGDIAVAGPAPQEGWAVAVTDNSDLSLATDDGLTQIVTLTSGGLATSSVTARRWRRGGSLLHHLVDPRTSLPAQGPWRTVSVTAVTCALANTASTAAIILGMDAPRWLRERKMHARLVSDDGSVVCVGDWPREQHGAR